MAYKQQKSISYSSGSWETQDQAPGGLVSGESQHPGSYMAIFLLCPRYDEEQGALLEFLM